MAVIQASFSTTAAIATNGTITFGYPTRWGTAPDVTTQGDFIGSYGHQAFAEGLQTLLNSPKDFTLTFGNTNITFTYLGTTSIPANSDRNRGRDRPMTVLGSPSTSSMNGADRPSRVKAPATAMASPLAR